MVKAEIITLRFANGEVKQFLGYKGKFLSETTDDDPEFVSFRPEHYVLSSDLRSFGKNPRLVMKTSHCKAIALFTMHSEQELTDSAVDFYYTNTSGIPDESLLLEAFHAAAKRWPDGTVLVPRSAAYADLLTTVIFKKLCAEAPIRAGFLSVSLKKFSGNFAGL